MTKAISAKQFLSRHVGAQDRVLLVNPPVEETRYSWIRWNQPLDLLKIAAHLRTNVGCDVHLLDCMKPDDDGAVPEELLPQDRRYRDRDGMRYPMRRFGLPYGALREWVYARQAFSPKKLPTQVWVTSLCSYWYGGVAEMCRIARQVLPDSKLVVIGNYPRLLPEHARSRCVADVIVNKSCEVEDLPAAFDLYGDKPPPFIALRLNPQVAIHEVSAGLKNQVVNYTFFEDDVCRDDGEALTEIVRETAGLHRHLRFHLICGLHPNRIPLKLAKLLSGRNFAALHFEEADHGAALDAELYRQVRAHLVEAGLRLPDDRLCGFVWIGRPGDDLDRLVERSFQVLDTFGSLILKPFSPTPGSPEHAQHENYLERLPIPDRSPHFFPFAELNGITCSEYHDLYRMAAFLNEKVRNRAFDFLQGTLGADLLRSSLEREVWKLAPSPLRIIDKPTSV